MYMGLIVSFRQSSITKRKACSLKVGVLDSTSLQGKSRLSFTSCLTNTPFQRQRNSQYPDHQ